MTMTLDFSDPIVWGGLLYLLSVISLMNVLVRATHNNDVETSILISIFWPVVLLIIFACAMIAFCVYVVTFGYVKMWEA
jgi:Na+/proline symporter